MVAIDTGDLDPRRNFTRAETRRAWEVQGRVCKLCRRAIPFDLMHGDHIAPWTSGGRTTMENLQVLCGSCNLRKGSRPQDVVAQYFDPDKLAAGRSSLRAWQAEACNVVETTILNRPMLIEACPGAGKTRFGLEVAYRLIAAGEVSRVLIIVPTLGIADGWVAAASKMNSGSPTLPLHGPRDWRAVNPIGDRWVGVVATYQSLSSMADMFLAHATDPGHRTLVVFDEVHHAGATGAWGNASQQAFAAGARAILSLTGTPFRTDRAPIVFVPSEGGSAKADYRYSYDQAIRDGVCRPVQFVLTKGHTTFRTEDGRTHDVSFDTTNLTEKGESRRLRAALEWIEPGSIADKMLSDANEYIIALRRAGDVDAAGLAVCVDCDHADRVARHIGAHLTGRRPVFACSRLHDENDPKPANAIKRFTTSAEPWLVAVNMVSEGIDIRRLRTVVYLTNRLTLLSFRQIVGRVVRSDSRNVDDHGRVYVPADPRLLDMANHVTDQVDLLPPPLVISTDPSYTHVSIVSTEERVRAPFQTIETVGQQGGAFDTEGRSSTAELIECARLFIQREGLQGTDPASLALIAQERPELLKRLLALRDEL